MRQNAVAERTCWNARGKALLALERAMAGSSATDFVFQVGEDAGAAGHFETATARYAEVLASLAVKPEGKTTISKHAARTRRPSRSALKARFDCDGDGAGSGMYGSVAVIADEFAGFAENCAFCGASDQSAGREAGVISSSEQQWIVCTQCKLVHYCSEACRRQAWACGHQSSCGAPLPTPASVRASSGEVASRTLHEFGRASVDVGASCLRRVTRSLESRPVTTYSNYPPSAGSPLSAAAAAKVDSSGQSTGGGSSSMALALGPRSRRHASAARLHSSVRAGLEAARAHLAHVEVQRLACRLVALVCEHGGRDAAIELGCVGAIVRGLASHPHDKGVAAALSAQGLHNESLRALLAVSLGEGPDIVAAMLAASALPPPPAGTSNDVPAPRRQSALEAVLAVLRVHPTRLATQRVGLAFLRRVATAFGLRGAAAIRASRTLEIATAALLRHPHDGELSSHAAALLHAIALDAPEAATEAAAEATPEATPEDAAASASRRRRDHNAARGAWEVLAQPGSVSALIAAMRLHGTREDVQRRGALALISMACIDDSCRLQVLGCPGCRTALIGALRHAPELKRAVAELQAKTSAYQPAFTYKYIGRGAPRTDETGEMLPRRPKHDRRDHAAVHPSTAAEVFLALGADRQPSPRECQTELFRGGPAPHAVDDGEALVFDLRWWSQEALRQQRQQEGWPQPEPSPRPPPEAAPSARRPLPSPQPSRPSSQPPSRRLETTSPRTQQQVQHGWSSGLGALTERLEESRAAARLSSALAASPRAWRLKAGVRLVGSARGVAPATGATEGWRVPPAAPPANALSATSPSGAATFAAAQPVAAPPVAAPPTAAPPPPASAGAVTGAVTEATAQEAAHRGGELEGGEGQLAEGRLAAPEGYLYWRPPSTAESPAPSRRPSRPQSARPHSATTPMASIVGVSSGSGSRAEVVAASWEGASRSGALSVRPSTATRMRPSTATPRTGRSAASPRQLE